MFLKESTLQITGKIPGNSPPEKGFIEFIDSGQVNVLENKDELELLGVFINNYCEKCFCYRYFAEKNTVFFLRL